MGDLVNQISTELQQGQKPIISICNEIATRNNIKPDSLRQAYYRSLCEKDRPHLNRQFSDQQEKIICGIALAFSSSGMPLTKSLLLSVIQDVIVGDAGWSGKGWFEGFKSRHSDLLSFSSGKGLDPQRVSNVTKEQIDRFISSFEYLQASYNLLDDYVINVDESSCNLKNNQVSSVLKSATSAKQGTMMIPQSVLRTIIPFVAASGKVWMVVYVFKTISIKSVKAKDAVAIRPIAKETRSTWPSYYAMTNEGYITNDLWVNIIATFVDLISCHLGDRHALLLLDRVSSHLEASTIKTLLDNNVELLYLPAHSSHILQPLDDIIFATFKAKAHEAKHKEIIRRQLTRQSLDTVTQDAVCVAEKQAFTTSIITKAFKNTGIWPFNKKLISERFAKEYLWTVKKEDITERKAEVESIAVQLKEHFIGNAPTKIVRVSAITEKSKLFTGSDLLIHHEERLKKGQEQAKLKQEKAIAKEEKKRKRAETIVNSKRPTKKHKVEPKISKSSVAVGISKLQCNACNDKISAKQTPWVCGVCNKYTLCVDCQYDVSAIELHRDHCS